MIQNSSTFTRWLDFGAFCLSLAVCCLTAEIVTRYFFVGKVFGEKVRISIPGIPEMAMCYSENGVLRGIDLREDAERFRQQFQLTEEKFTQLRQRTPICITHSVSQRRNGSKPKRAERAVLVGDSFAFGEGVADDATLAVHLDNAFPQINFQTFAWPGDDLERVSHAVEQLPADPERRAIIYVFNLNDLELAPRFRMPDGLDLQNFYGATYEAQQKRLPILLRQSAAAVLVAGLIARNELSQQTVSAYQATYSAAENQEKIKDLRKQLLRLRNSSLGKAGEFGIVFYPLLFKDGGNYPFAAIHHLLLDICRSEKLTCFDGSLAFREVQNVQELQVHVADFHPNGLAHGLLAEALKQNCFLGLCRKRN